MATATTQGLVPGSRSRVVLAIVDGSSRRDEVVETPLDPSDATVLRKCDQWLKGHGWQRSSDWSQTNSGGYTCTIERQ